MDGYFDSFITKNSYNFAGKKTIFKSGYKIL